MGKIKYVLLVCIAFLLMLLPGTVVKAEVIEGTCGENLTWVFDDGTGTLTISGTGEMWDYFFTDVPWNSVCDEILDVEIGIGITSIGDYAFYNCSSLMEIEIPESVLTIGANVFVGCYDLYSIYLPASLESIGQSAFETESFYPHILYAGTEEQWNEVALDGDSVFDVDTVFHYSARGDEIEVIEICSMIGYNCSCCEGNPMWVRKDEANHRFANGICSECGVEEVWSYIIRETGEVTITDYAGNATILTIPSTIEGLPVTEIGRKAFKDCRSVTEIIIPEEVTSICDAAFENCYDLKKVIIPEGLISLGAKAFYYCDSLDEISLPIGITSINDNTFYRCSSLKKVTFPEGILNIGYGAFYFCSSLEKAVLPEGILNIGYSAFYGCNSLTEVTIPKSVVEIGPYAFCECGKLCEIILPDGLTNIGAAAFSSCSSLSEIIIPEGVTTLENSVFGACSNLIKIELPEGLESIGPGALGGCFNLETITIPDTVTSISPSAFEYCTSLREIIIPDGVTVIEEYTFRHCEQLCKIYIPQSMTTIETLAFDATSEYLHVLYQGTEEQWNAIEKSDSEIVGYGCHYEANGEELAHIETCSIEGYECSICDKVFTYWKDDEVGHNFVDGACTECGVENTWKYTIGANGEIKITEYNGTNGMVVVPEQIEGFPVKVIGTWSFRRYINDIVLPETVTTIETQAFVSCFSLRRIYIPKNVITIDSASFYNCGNIDEIIFLGEDITITNTSNISFDDTSDDLQIYCIEGSMLEEKLLACGVIPKSLEEYEILRCWSDDTYFYNFGETGVVCLYCNPYEDIRSRIIWTIEDESVVEVDEKGKVTTLALGTTTITASIGDECSVSCIITVLPCKNCVYGEWAENVVPGCESKGEESRTCEICGYYETREVDALGHDYESVVTEPNCTEEGYTTHSCKNCDHSYVDTYVDAVGHIYGDWLETVAPGCETKGEERRDCENCDLYETRELDALGHDHESVVTAPTCTEKGYTTHSCKNCDYSYVDTYVDATGHSFGEWAETKAPTTEAEGEERRECETCEHYETRTIDKLPAEVVLTGWQKIDGKWYYYNIEGKAVTGWQSINKKWYFFNTSGVMQTGWLKDGGSWYYLNTDGDMATSWKKVNNKWYYFGTDGKMSVSWKKIGTKWYYFNSDGDMAIGWKKIGTKWYYFNTNGDMHVSWKKLNNKWYYFNSDGDMHVGWKAISGTWYYFNADGDMHVGWKSIGGTWYYFNSDGDMHTGWKQINGTWYYFTSDGAMVTGRYKINGTWNTFTSDGVWVG